MTTLRIRRKSILLALPFLTFVLCGSTCDQVRPSKPTSIKCDASCFSACESLTGWNGARDNADYLSDLFNLHDQQQLACDGQRAECVACINTAIKAGSLTIFEINQATGK